MDKDRMTNPLQDGFRMPAEYEKHFATLMIWPERPGSWNHGALKAREAFSKIALTIAEHEQLFMMVSDEAYESANKMIGFHNNVQLVRMKTDDAWARDTGATFVVSADERRAIDWQFNAWGGQYDGLYASWDNDQLVAARIARELGDEIYSARHFVLEGGSIHVDGEGTLITTKECLLSRGRNPNMSITQIEDELKKYLSVKKIIWLPEGIFNDETNGHVDNFCCFTAPGEVLLAWTDDVDDPQYERSVRALEILKRETDAKGRKLTVKKLPIPSKPIRITEKDLEGYEFEEGEDIREVGERLAASYINFYVANGCVLVPQFGDESDRTALDIIGSCFKDRQIVGIYARDILTGGGNIHCITQQIPAVKREK